MSVSDADFVGMTFAKAGPHQWFRQNGEDEASCVQRVRTEASVAKHEFVYMTGHIRVEPAPRPITVLVASSSPPEPPPCPAVEQFAPPARSNGHEPFNGIRIARR